MEEQTQGSSSFLSGHFCHIVFRFHGDMSDGKLNGKRNGDRRKRKSSKFPSVSTSLELILMSASIHSDLRVLRLLPFLMLLVKTGL